MGFNLFLRIIILVFSVCFGEEVPITHKVVSGGRMSLISSPQDGGEVVMVTGPAREPSKFVTNMTNQNVTVVENSNVTLSCKTIGKPPPEIMWLRNDGRSLTIGGNEILVYISRDWNFIVDIENLLGTYLCEGSNGDPPARIYLHVEFPPLMFVFHGLVGARENTDVNLECQTLGPRYHANLTRNNNRYKSNMTLTIRNLQPEVYGYNQCVAKNPLGETQGTIKLFKQHFPTHMTRKVVTGGKTIFPAKRIIIVLDDAEYTWNTAIRTIHDVRCTIYLCVLYLFWIHIFMNWL